MTFVSIKAQKGVEGEEFVNRLLNEYCSWAKSNDKEIVLLYSDIGEYGCVDGHAVVFSVTDYSPRLKSGGSWR